MNLMSFVFLVKGSINLFVVYIDRFSLNNHRQRAKEDDLFFQKLHIVIYSSQDSFLFFLFKQN